VAQRPLGSGRLSRATEIFPLGRYTTERDYHFFGAFTLVTIIAGTKWHISLLEISQGVKIYIRKTVKEFAAEM
jgi:hypothetical protein